MPNNENDVVFRELDLGAEIKNIWGSKWNAPETEYEFSNGRKFDLRTSDSGIYAGTQSSGDEILLEDDGEWLTEDDALWVQE